MAEWVCNGCGCRFSVGAPRCPECRVMSAVENGDLDGPDVYASESALEVESEQVVPAPRGKTSTTTS